MGTIFRLVPLLSQAVDEKYRSKTAWVFIAVGNGPADILIADRPVALNGNEINSGADTVIDASGRQVMPGRVDRRDKY